MSKHLDYDEPVLGYHRILSEMVAKMAEPNSAVADIGCGTGQIIADVAERRPDLRLTAIDSDEECLRRTKVRCPTVRTVHADIGRLASDAAVSDGFKILVSSHALEHVADPVGALQQWKQLLTRDGKVVLAVPNVLQPIMIARALFRRPKANRGHYYIWDRATFENFCRLAGFSIVDQRIDYVPLVPVRVRTKVPGIEALERALLSPFPQFSNSHIVVLEPLPDPDESSL